MKHALITFAVILLVISILILPKLNLLSSLVELSVPPELASENTETNTENPLMEKAVEEVEKLVNSISMKIYFWVISISLLFVSIGGVYASIQVFRGKPIPTVLMIFVCGIFLIAGGAPWDLLFLFQEVNGFEKLFHRVSFLWGLHPLRYSLIYDILIGGFYLITGVAFCFYFIKLKTQKL